MTKTVCLGAGFTGLAAGYASGAPIFEAQDSPGGICSSYYKDGYRFEKGGGHWIFGGDPAVLHFLSRFCEFKTYERKASVFFADTGEFVRYPIQEQYPNEVGRFDKPATTMKEWLAHKFSDRLCERFFFPFHEKYTAGLYTKIAPQDGYKTPGNGRGYNATFRYPVEGLDVLAKRIAEKCDVRYGVSVGAIDGDLYTNDVYLASHFGSGAKEIAGCKFLISTIPLNQAVAIADLRSVVDAEPDPYTSVVVLNIAAKRGPKCPDDHWVYLPQSISGIHRCGFYSNVDTSFLPHGAKDRVSIYAEKSFRGGEQPDMVRSGAYLGFGAVIDELQSWGWIGDIDVVDPTWIDCAYTWRWPGSTWREQALAKLEEHGIYQCGRFARWKFSGIADSVRDGLLAGAAFRE